MSTTDNASSRRDRRDAARTSRREATRAREAAQKRRQLLLALGGAVAIALLAVVAIVIATRPDEGSDLPPMVAVSDPYPGIPQSTKLLGDPNAAIRLVEYGDFQCPVCQQFDQQVVPDLVQRYVASGLIAFEFRDYLVIDGNLERQRGDDYDRESLRAAAGAMCAGDQGQYWAFHASLYRNHTGEGVGDFSEARIDQLAATMGLDTAAFDQCMASGNYQDAVEQQSAAAQVSGVTGTPTFMIGDQQIPNGTADAMSQQIDAILTANGITPPAASAVDGVTSTTTGATGDASAGLAATLGRERRIGGAA
jgi:protein-disulfide isomerase